MREFWILFKVNFINTFGLSKLKKKFARSGKFVKVGVPILSTFIALLIIGIVFLYVYMFSSFFIATGQYEGILVLAVVVGSVFCFITSLTKANGYLFESKDFDLLMSMPIGPKAIIFSKISNLFLLNYLSFGAIYIPSVVYYAIFATPAIWFYPLAFLVFIIGPFLLVAISSILSYLIGLILSRFKYKNLIQIVVFTAFLVVMVYGSMSINQQTDMDPEQMELIVQQMINVLYKVYYPAKWAVNGLTGDFLQLLIYIGISIIPFVLFVYIIAHNYVKANSRAKRSYREKNFKLTEQKVNGQFGSLLKREFKRYFSNSGVVLNTLAGPIMSLLFALMFLFGSDTFGDSIDKITTELSVLIIIALQVMMSGVSPTTASSISLEGKTFWIIKSSPVSPSKVLLSKITMNLILSMPAAIIVTIATVIVLPVGIIEILLLIFVPNLFLILSSLTGMLFNLIFPKMEWDNPIKPVKQGLATVLTMIVDWVLLTVLIVTFVVLMPFGLLLSYGVIIAILLVVSIVMAILVFTYGPKKFQKIPA